MTPCHHPVATRAVLSDNPTPYLGGGDFFDGIYEATYAIAVVIFLAAAVVAKGRSIIRLGNIFTRGRFGGGRSGGGDARGKW